MAGITIGGVKLRELEIPSSVHFGGPHMLAVHRYLGGGRVIDAMGDDPRPTSWSGIFLGPSASSRARLLQGMKEAGQRVTVTYGSFSAQCVVREFDADYEREYQVRYQISVEIITTGGGGSAAPSFGLAIANDFAVLTSTYAAPAVPDSVAAAIGAAQDATAAVAATTATGLLDDASLSAMQRAVDFGAAAADAVDSAFTAADSSLTGLDLDAASGASVVDGTASFTAEQLAATALADLAGARGYAGRLAANLETYGG